MDTRLHRPGHEAEIPPLNVLILDDNEVDILRLRRLCTKAGYQFDIDEAATLQEFRARLDTQVYDVVFIDFNLGGATGIEALALLNSHADQSEALAIMVTSVTGHQTAVEAMRLGCADYLVKEELSIPTLQRAVAQAIERRILLTAASRTEMLRTTLERRVKRFAQSCGPEVRAVLSGLRREIAHAKRHEDLDPGLRVTLTQLEAGARDITVLIDDVTTLALDAVEPGRPAARG
ncbi:response regulator [Frigidibacter sp. MR17.24]|uniref:response regulator n=1 Tax=Frigidibacter sp. MR17.24 TaxID=3127345 RepID=UPI0030130395